MQFYVKCLFAKQQLSCCLSKKNVMVYCKESSIPTGMSINIYLYILCDNIDKIECYLEGYNV